jgi:hypothetical protein
MARIPPHRLDERWPGEGHFLSINVKILSIMDFIDP